MRQSWKRLALLSAFAAATAVLSARMVLGNPSALWDIVHGQCVPHMSAETGPAPCAVVHPPSAGTAGYALLKDVRGVAQYLLIPTQRISGIEDPQVLEPDVDALWQAGWDARPLVEQALGHGLPEDAYGMAINSAGARSQDQLHIHLDCLSADVLRNEPAFARLGPDWSDIPLTLPGGPYRGLRISGDLKEIAPFRRLASSLSTPADMGSRSLAIFRDETDPSGPAFILLATTSQARGHAEDLLDHSCQAVLAKK